jgi:large subunit ribosomal protein L6
MSRVGKKPVALPAGTSAKVEGQKVSVKGPKGELSFTAPESVGIALDGNQVKVTQLVDTREARAAWGSARARIANLAIGVTKGFEKKLEINGVGYRAALQGKVLKLNLGFSHDVDYAIPTGITVVTPKPTEIVVSGTDKQLVGQVAAEIRDYRGPEPYKGKGVKYADEFIFRKVGKAKK